MSLFIPSLVFLSLLGSPLQSYEEHAPILITDDEDFQGMDLLTGNGVRSGAGTPADPYIIENWVIVANGPNPAVHLQNTSAHVIVRNLTVNVAPSTFWALRAWQTSNVTFSEIRINGEAADVAGHDTIGTRVERVFLDRGDITLMDGRDGAIVRNQLGRGTIEVDAGGHIEISDNFVNANRRGIDLSRLQTDDRIPQWGSIAVERNRILADGQDAILVDPATAGRVCGNQISGGDDTAIYIEERAPGPLRLDICDNFIQNVGRGIYLFDTSGVHVTNNTVRESSVGFSSVVSSANVTGNYLVNNRVGILAVPVADDATSTVQHNLILENEIALKFHNPGSIDVRYNWWGVETDPARAGDDTGTNRIERHAAYAPWCLDPDCSSYSKQSQAFDPDAGRPVRLPEVPHVGWGAVTAVAAAVALAMRRRGPED